MNLPATIPVPQPAKNKGGRPKGSRNRSSMLLKTIQVEMEKLYGLKDWDPAVMLASIAGDSKQPVEIRIVAAGKILPLLHGAAKQQQLDPMGKKDPVNMERLMTKIAKDLLIENKVPTSKDFEPEDEETDEDDPMENNTPLDSAAD